MNKLTRPIMEFDEPGDVDRMVKESDKQVEKPEEFDPKRPVPVKSIP